MKKLFLSTMAVMLLLASTANAQDDEMKPLAVFSFGGYQEMLDDLELVGKLSDNPDLAKGLEGLIEMATQGQGLPGLDKKRPWGASIASDGLQFSILAFLPVDDLEGFLDVLAPLAGEAEEVDDGVWSIELEMLAGQSLYFKQHNNWTFISIMPEFMADLPDDPVKMLGGLNKKYDVAARIHFQNIPEIFRQLLVDGMKQGLEGGGLPGGLPLPGGLSEGLPGLDGEGAELPKELLKSQLDTLAEQLEETDTLTFGMSIDRETKTIVVDITTIAIEGSQTAQAMTKLASAKTRFGGFLDPEATLSVNVAMTAGSSDVGNIKAMYGTLKEELLGRIADIDELPAGEAGDLVNEIVGELLAIGDATIEAGKIDAGIAVRGKGPFSIVAGAHVPDGGKFQQWIDHLIDTAETQIGFYGFEKDVDKLGDIRFHSASIPIPGGETGDKISAILGDQLEIVFGAGKDSVYVAMAEEGALESLKKAIEKSKEMADTVVPPLRASVSLGPVIKLMADFADETDPNMSLLVDALKGGNDRLHVTIEPIERGTTTHIVGEEGLLKAFGALITSLGPGMLPQF